MRKASLLTQIIVLLESTVKTLVRTPGLSQKECFKVPGNLKKGHQLKKIVRSNNQYAKYSLRTWFALFMSGRANKPTVHSVSSRNWCCRIG